MKFPEPSLQIDHLDEPKLEFGYGQTCHHPKDGLFLYGPQAYRGKTKEIRLGVVGTKEGLGHFRSWSRKLLHAIALPPPGKGEKQDRLHLANFPGLAEAFGVTFDPDEISTLSIPYKDVDEASRLLNLNEAVDTVSRLYIDRVKNFVRNEEAAIDLWVLIIPEIVFDRCRPGSKRSGLSLIPGNFGKKQRAKSDLPLLELMGAIDQSQEEIFHDAPDFHRRIKAEFLGIGPTQLLRETTLEPEAFTNSVGYPQRQPQDPASTAWNIATGMYYKTQSRPPWRLSSMRDGVCYIGMVYKNLPHDPKGHACCAAQMFLTEGDGVVFRGANGPWRTGDYEYHLSSEAAKNLLSVVLSAFEENQGGVPKELFIHGQTYFNDAEWRAYCEVAPEETNIVGVRIRKTFGETKLFRDGDYPVLRGTALILDEKSAYLWTSGYIPQLDTYIGPETPNPLLISVVRSRYSNPDIRIVLKDIMGLTKINYNSCNFNDGLPVTVRFAQMVGDVLTMGSAKGQERQPFKYYV